MTDRDLSRATGGERDTWVEMFCLFSLPPRSLPGPHTIPCSPVHLLGWGLYGSQHIQFATVPVGKQTQRV